MVKRKKLNLILFILLIAIVLSLLCFIFFLVIDISKSFIFLISYFVLIILSYSFLIAFFSLQKIFSDIKSELKVFDGKEKAVRDIYRYEQFLNPPDIDN